MSSVKKCPCKNCETSFSGSASQIAHNFNTHYKGAHIKKGEHGDFDDNKKELIKLIGEEVFREIISSFEPEITQDDEFLNSLEKGNVEEAVDFDLSKYLAKTPVCREERQFALFFANKLKLKDEKVIEVLTKAGVLSSSDIIKEVFFEVTVLRDYLFYKNNDEKDLFNKSLLKFVTTEASYKNTIEHKFKEIMKDINSYNANYECAENNNGLLTSHANHWKNPHHIAKWMMNAKPDIGLITCSKPAQKFKLTFIECKYESNVDYYKNEDLPIGMKQIDLQRLILKFLCDDIGAKYNSDPIVNGNVHLVKFYASEKQNANKDNEIRIPIKELLCK
jgi:hypothetical protein